jgi:hypothetical protein
MAKLIGTICFIVIFAISLFAQTQLSTGAGVSDDEYKFLSSRMCSKDSQVPSIFQADTLYGKVSAEKNKQVINEIHKYYTAAKLPDATEDLIKDFNERNDKSYLLKQKLFTNCYCSLFTKQELKKMFDDNGWTALQLRFPKMINFIIVSFSRIGFSPNKNQAFLFSEAAGAGIGEGTFLFFAKEKGKWINKIAVERWAH